MCSSLDIIYDSIFKIFIINRYDMNKNMSIKDGQSEVLLNCNKGSSFFIYGEIDDTFPIQILVPFNRFIHNTKNENSDINIYINSIGGDIYYANEMVSLIEYAKTKGFVINTFVLSRAASAASYIAIMGTNRFGSKRAMHLIHYPSSSDLSENPIMFRRNLETYNFLTEKMIEGYEEYCCIPNLRENMFNDNFHIYSEDLIKYKLIDSFL